ncbi:MAG: alkane 1-monooxygenase [Aquincola sp.]|nr:alkane 1-monooxygenase [Aquincola sp.]MDH4288362.1 alkane 1-monooxygenase [Aquincola sp.]MDH5329582.1 alkane 1-monooxygenase [Aquincola sp.]
MHLRDLRFALAWTLPLAVGVAAWRSPWAAWGVVFAFQGGLALVEAIAPHWTSPPAESASRSWFGWCLRLHVLWQGALLALGVAIAARWTGEGGSPWAIVALGIGIGGVTGSQGITFAHELGHSRSRVDRTLGWVLMSSVLYAHFMVEHYRGHHARAATPDDPASARRGESLWRFLPRTLAGSFASAWRLEAQQRALLRRGWLRSPLAWATMAQLVGLAALAITFGAGALLFWLVQAAYAAFLLEAINYIEHYGLERGAGADGRPEPFATQHAWNADHALTNCFIANLPRHSDHHMHAWKPYAMLEALPGPQLPAGYAGCLFLASVPRLWFRAMEPRLAAL